MKYSLKTLICGIALVGLLSLPESVFALQNKSIEVKAGNNQTIFSNGSLLVPLADTAKQLGILVKWDGNKKKAVADGVEVAPGSTKAFYKGVQIDFDTAAIISNGKMLVPVRLFEYLGATVKFNDEGDGATITYAPEFRSSREIYGNPADGEKDVFKKLDYRFAWDFAEKLSQFQDAVNNRGFHLAGSNAGNASAKYIYDTFKKIGLNPEYDEFPVTAWTYYSSSINVKGHSELDYIPVTAAPYTPGTPKAGLSGQLVDVGNASKDELEGVDLTGKIALVNLDMDVHVWMNTAAYQCQKHGAAGVLYYCTKYYATEPSGEAEFVGDWSGERSRIPVFSVAQKYGKILSELAKKETLEVTLFADTRTDENATGKNVIGMIKGTKYPDEYIIINGHHDAYFKCFQDDSAGVGIMTALAKAMKDSGYQPDHTIIFAATDGEEAGDMDTMYDWLIGSWHLINKKIDKWSGKIVNAHTSEMCAYENETAMTMRVSDVMVPFAVGALSDVNVQGYPQKGVTVTNYMSTGADWWSFNYYGAPVTRNDFYAAEEMNHSSLDKPDAASFEMLKDELNQAMQLIVRLDRQPLAPYDLSITADKFINAIDSEALKSQGYSEELINAAAAFRDNAAEMFKKQLEVAALYQKAKIKGADTSKADALLPAYNQAMRDAVKEMTMGTNYLALAQPIYQTVYYQTLPGELKEAAACLKNGNGEAMLENFNMNVPGFSQYYQDYTATLEKDTWKSAFKEALNPESPDNKLNWATGRLLKYYDIYDVLEGVKAKLKKGGQQDYSAEIEALEKMAEDADEKLSKAYADDSALWSNINEKLPTKQLEEIENILESLVK